NSGIRFQFTGRCPFLRGRARSPQVLCEHFVAVRNHGAEFQARKGAHAVTEACVSIENRTTVRRLDQTGDQAEQRRQRYQRAKCNDNVESAFKHSPNRLLWHSCAFPSKKPDFGLHQLSCTPDDTVKSADAASCSTPGDPCSKVAAPGAEV